MGDNETCVYHDDRCAEIKEIKENIKELFGKVNEQWGDEKQTPQTMTSTISGYTPSATKSRMSQAIQQPTYNQIDTTALKQKDWVIKK